MNRTELVNAVAAKSGMSKKDCDKVICAAVEAVTEALKAGEKVSLVGFGTFETKERAARTGRNPRTKEAIQIAATKLPVFKAGKALKDAVAE